MSRDNNFMVRHGWPLLAVAAVAAVMAALNATSRQIESASRGVAIDLRAPWAWEISSVILVVGLAPLIAEAVRRFPIGPASWRRNLPIHLALTLPFSALHVAGMVWLRKLAYAAAGATYDFSHGNLPLAFVYEYRKDALVYAAIAGFYWYLDQQRTAAPPVAPGGDGRIEIKQGGRTFFLAPAEIAQAEAAGNYVELHAGGRTHLVRGALASFEEKLAPHGFIRVHRSRLLNKARIKSFAATPAGDLEITLDDGRVVQGSRRYRAALTG